MIYFSREELKELQNFGHHVLPHTHKYWKNTENQLNNEFEMCDAEYIFKTAVNGLIPYVHLFLDMIYSQVIWDTKKSSWLMK